MIGQTIAADDDAILLVEFNHRLCNTLQIIGAGVAECSRLKDDAIRPYLITLADRLRALACLHRLLSQPLPTGILEDYCRSLSINLVQVFDREDVTPWVQMEDAPLTLSQYLKTGLMVVELVTNVLKHSLHNDGGTVWVQLRVRNGWVILSVCDSRRAPGVPAHVPRILAALAESLGGEAFAIDRNGYCAGARFPLDPSHARTLAEPRRFAHEPEDVLEADVAQRHEPRGRVWDEARAF